MKAIWELWLWARIFALFRLRARDVTPQAQKYLSGFASSRATATELSVYERLGAVRSRALTLGKIADVLQTRGELDEALRIRREDVLPVFERRGLARDLLRARRQLAKLYLRRGAEGDRTAATGSYTSPYRPPTPCGCPRQSKSASCCGRKGSRSIPQTPDPRTPPHQTRSLPARTAAKERVRQPRGSKEPAAALSPSPPSQAAMSERPTSKRQPIVRRSSSGRDGRRGGRRRSCLAGGRGGSGRGSIVFHEKKSLSDANPGSPEGRSASSPF